MNLWVRVIAFPIQMVLCTNFCRKIIVLGKKQQSWREVHFQYVQLNATRFHSFHNGTTFYTDFFKLLLFFSLMKEHLWWKCVQSLVTDVLLTFVPSDSVLWCCTLIEFYSIIIKVFLASSKVYKQQNHWNFIVSNKIKTIRIKGIMSQLFGGLLIDGYRMYCRTSSRLLCTD